MPVWVSYKGNVPDSIQDFFKTYLQTKGKIILNTQQALEMIFDQANANLPDILSNQNMTENEFIEKIEKSRKPVCNNLSIELFKNKNDSDKLIPDRIEWYVLQKYSLDTIRHIQTFYLSGSPDNNPYIPWRNFADTVLASGLLK